MSRIENILTSTRMKLSDSTTSLQCTQIFMQAISDLKAIEIKPNAAKLNDACNELSKLMSSEDIISKYADPNIINSIRMVILARYHAIVLEDIEPPTQITEIALDPDLRRLALGIPKRSATATKRKFFTPQRFDVPDSKVNYYPNESKRPKPQT